MSESVIQSERMLPAAKRECEFPLNNINGLPKVGKMAHLSQWQRSPEESHRLLRS